MSYFKATLVSGLLLASSAFAVEAPDYSARIDFSQGEMAKWIVYSSYQQLLSRNEQLDRLHDLASAACNSALNSQQRLEMDNQYQAILDNMTAITNEHNHLAMFKDRDGIRIKLFVDSQPVVVELDHLSADSLGIKNLSVISLSQAGRANQALEEARSTIKTMLPDSIDPVTLNYMNAKSSDTEYNYTLRLKTKDEQRQLIQNLISIRGMLLAQITDMQAVARQAMAGDTSDDQLDELDQDLQALIFNFDIQPDGVNILHSLHLLADNNLIRYAADNKQRCNFPAFDPQTLEISDTGLKTQTDSYRAVKQLEIAEKNMRDWMLADKSCLK